MVRFSCVFLFITIFTGPSSSLSFLSTLQQGLDIGESITNAINTYLELSDVFKAKAYIEISNYVQLPLAQSHFVVGKGITTNLPEIISGGSKEAVTIHQNTPLGGVEILASWGLENGLRIFVYVRVFQQIAGRPPNSMAVTINKAGNNWAGKLFTHEFITSLGYTQFDNVQKTIQCCALGFCVQGIMTSHHQTNVTIRLLPRRVERLAVGKFNTELQSDLDHMLDNSQTCNIPDYETTPFVELDTTSTTGPNYETTPFIGLNTTPAEGPKHDAIVSSAQNMFSLRTFTIIFITIPLHFLH